MLYAIYRNSNFHYHKISTIQLRHRMKSIKYFTALKMDTGTELWFVFERWTMIRPTFMRWKFTIGSIYFTNLQKCIFGQKWNLFSLIFRDEIKIKNLIETFRNEFGRLITIEPINCSNRTDLGLELKYQFREELNALEELAQNLKYKTNNVQKCYRKFLHSQHKTDSVWSELIHSTTN